MRWSEDWRRNYDKVDKTRQFKKRSLYRVLDENEKRVNKIEFCVNNGRLSDRRCVSMGTT